MCLQKAYSKQERNRGECQKKVHLGSPWNAVLGSLAMSGGGVDMALDLHPRGHRLRRLGDCFQQALMAS